MGYSGVSEDASFIGNGYPIKVDSDGNPHIAYSGKPSLGYASWNGSGWNIQQIPSYAFAHDLALDANGNPHITLGSLAYATWNGTGWNFQTVTTDYTVYSSLALDSSGNPHVAYVTGDKLKYATRNGSNWTTQTVDTSPEIGLSVSLALDPNDTPYIMYCTHSSFVDDNGIATSSVNIRLAVWKNSRWNIEPVLSSSNLISFGNMVLDSKGYPHFIASKGHFISPDVPGFLSNILYVSWDGFAWNVQTVASNVNLVKIGFLALSPNDYPHIVYTTTSDEVIEQLVYARWTGAAWGWESHTVDTQGITYKPCYLAVDSKGNPHISYLKIPPDQTMVPDRLNLMHATATIPYTPPPAFPDSILLLVSAAIITATAISVVAYVWKKKMKQRNVCSLSLSKQRFIDFFGL